MTHEQEAPGMLSTEVVGRLTDPQKEELNILASAIIQAQGINEVTDEHRQNAVAVVGDSVMRGLEVEGRTWFRPDDQVSTTFDTGFQEREAILAQVKRLKDKATRLRLTTINEEVAADAITPFTPDLSGAEELRSELAGRQRAVTRWHKALFVDSQLAPEARVLRQSTARPFEGDVEREEEEFTMNNRLYANFLLNGAVYGKPGLMVEPQDVAALGRMWQDPQVRAERQQELRERMVQLAKQRGIPDRHIGIYTQLTLQHMESLVSQGDIRIEDLAVADVFAIPVEALLEQEREMAEAGFETRAVPQEDLDTARNAIEAIHMMYDESDALMDDIGEDESRMPELEQHQTERYTPQFTEIDPLSLYFTYHHALADEDGDQVYNIPRLEEDLQDLVPLQNYVDTLQMLQAERFVVIETGEEIPELTGDARERTQTAIAGEVVRRLQQGRLKEGENAAAAIAALPINILGEYLNSGRLSDEEVEAVASLSTQQWVRMLSEYGVQAVPPGYVKEDELLFSPESQFLEEYMKQLPPEKRQAVTAALQRVITF